MVSVIVPFYNSQEYLEMCIKSIVRQTYSDIEIILIDDGSTDLSYNIACNWTKKDKRIKLVHQSNKGVSSARNLGIGISSGEWICFVDSDDVVSPVYVSTMLKAIKLYSAEIVAFPAFENNSSENEVVEVTKQKITNDLFENKFYGYPWNKLFSSTIIKNNSLFFDESISICEDLLFCYEYCLKVNKGIEINCNTADLYTYRLTENSVTAYRTTKKEQNKINAYEKIISLDNGELSCETLNKVKNIYSNTAIHMILCEWKNENSYNKELIGKCLLEAKKYYKQLCIKDKFLYWILKSVPFILFCGAKVYWKNISMVRGKMNE